MGDLVCARSARIIDSPTAWLYVLDGDTPLIRSEEMAHRFAVGDCVRVADGRVGRVRALEAGKYRIRVQRRTSKTHQFLLLRAGELSRVECPRGWMSPDGYRRYLKPTLAKQRERQRKQKKKRGR